ncbi:MAG: nitrogen fixation protein NifM [Methylocystaceae bacterium]|nr:nitrogen fixation protein NifM [Methylocystaceae bacterium]
MMSEFVANDAELMAYHVLKSAQAHFDQAPSELTAQQKKTVSQTAKRSLELEYKILASPEAKEVVIPTHSIAKALEEIEGRYENPDDFLKSLLANGLTIESMQTSLRRELWVEAVLDRVSSDIEEIEESEIIAFYQKNQSKFYTEETRFIRHILVTENDDYKENTKQAVAARLEEMKKALEDGGDFAKLASENSECPTALNGGEVGTVKRGQLYPEIDEIAFSLEEGGIGGPVETEIGFHLVKCEAIAPARQASLFDAKEQIVTYLTEKKRTHAQRVWLHKLSAK